MAPDGSARAAQGAKAGQTMKSPRNLRFASRRSVRPPSAPRALDAPSDPRHLDGEGPDRRRELALRRFPAFVAWGSGSRRCRRSPRSPGSRLGPCGPPRAPRRRTPFGLVSRRSRRVTGSGLATLPGVEGSSRPCDLAASRLIGSPERLGPFGRASRPLLRSRCLPFQALPPFGSGPALRPVSPFRSLGPLGAMRNVTTPRTAVKPAFPQVKGHMCRSERREEE